MKKLFTLILLLGIILQASAKSGLVLKLDSPKTTVSDARNISSTVAKPTPQIIHILPGPDFKADSPKTTPVAAPAASQDPFSFADFSWLNGNNRQDHKLLDNQYFTGDFTFDMNYTRSNNNPIDNT